MKQHYSWSSFLSGFSILILILDSKTALQGAQDGIALCLQSIIPALFPFIFLNQFFANGMENIPFFHTITRLCGLPKGCEGIFLSGFLGGYPVGAQCVSQAWKEEKIGRSTAEHMLTFCSNAGPSFIFGILSSQFPDKKIPWLLWGIHMGSAVLCGMMFSQSQEQTFSPPINPRSTPVTHPTAALHIIAGICGWVILFRVLLAFLSKWVFVFLPEPTQVLLSGLLELANGCCLLSIITDLRIRFLVCSVMLSFGGICVLLQTKSVIGQLPIHVYLRGKILQAFLSFLLCIGFLYRNWYPFTVAVILFLLIQKKRVAIRKYVMYNKIRNLRRKQYAVSKEN